METKASDTPKSSSFFDKIHSFFRSAKFQKIFYPSFYFLMAIAFVWTGCFLFTSRYYTNVYVSGSSMMPTLLGGGEGINRCYYGISDNHRKTVQLLKRFDVAITYYPNGWSAGEEDTVYKIKRVWGFPGETIKMQLNEEGNYQFTVTKDNELIYEVTGEVGVKTYNYEGTSLTYRVASFETEKRTFDTRVSRNDNVLQRTYFEVTLDKDKQEYFLMGDNWTSSSDSYSHIGYSEKISQDNIQGRVVCLLGTARSVNGQLVDQRKMKRVYYF